MKRTPLAAAGAIAACIALLHCRNTAPAAPESPSAPTIATVPPNASALAFTTPHTSSPTAQPQGSQGSDSTPPPVATGLHRAGPTTPGKVQCGLESLSCDTATQVCCIDPTRPLSEARCVPNTNTTDRSGPCNVNQHPVTMLCDDATDCPSGQACCVQDIASGDTSAYTYECAPFPCNLSEVCIPGGQCSRPGFSCVSDGDGFFGDTCSISAPTSRCGTATCSGKASICCWDAKSKASRCVEATEHCMNMDADPETIETIAFNCSSPADCGGYPCARGPMGYPYPVYGCSSHWATGDMGWTILCQNAADCPTYHGRTFRGCKADSSLPGWAKSCAYEW